MKTIKDKQLLVGADFAGYPLKETVVAHLKKKGWTITDVGVTADSDPDDTDLMFHRIGLRVGSMISEGEFERALVFCGTGMGMSMVANKHKGIRAACCESTYAVESCRRINNANVLCMGAFILGPQLACDMAERFVMTPFAEGFEAERIAYIKERDADMAKIEEANFKQISKNFNF